MKLTLRLITLVLGLTLGCVHAQSPSGQGGAGGLGGITQQPGSVATLTITSTDPLPGALQSVPYQNIMRGAGGTPCIQQFPYNWAVILGSLPPGMFIEGRSGSINGFTTGLGTFTFTMEATDCGGQHADKVLHITVTAPSLPVITTTSPLPGCIVGTNCTDQLVATGGTPAYTWSQTAGALPPGCTFPSGAGSDSLVCSPPTTSGTFNFTALVTDSLSNPSTPVAFNVTMVCPVLNITSNSSWPAATQNQPYSLQLTSTGGTGTLTWGVSSLPSGLNINTSTGLVSGTPTVAGAFLPKPQVTDSCLPTGTTVHQTANLTVNSNSGPLSLTTATPLPTLTQNVPATIPLVAQGGTPPYTYSNPSANLPTGLSISGATITGTPTGSGTTGSITLRVTDNVSATNDGNSPYSVTINAAGGGGDDSRYCPNGVWTGGSADGVATLPTACNYTPLSATPASGPVKTVCAGGGCDFTTVTAAVAAASCGWIIKIKSTSDGTPTGTPLSYNGTFAPATVCGNSNWIWVETDQVTGLPPEGTRITPAWDGIVSIPGRPAYAQPASPGVYVPKLLNNAKVMNCTAGVSHWRFMGLAITTVAGTTITGDVNSCIGGDNIIFDRIIGWSGNSTTWQSTDQVKTFLDLNNTTSKSVINSYIGEMHTNATGSNDLNLGGCSAVDEGPTKVVNNFLEAADSFSSVGGCGVGAGTVVMSNIEVRRNHIFKPTFWKTNDPSYFGTLFAVKDQIDWKNITKGIIEGNILDTTWGQQSDQPGPLLELGAKNQSSFLFATVNTSGTAVTATSGTFPSTMTASNCATPNQCLIIINGVGFKVVAQADTTHVTINNSAGVQTGVTAKAYAPGQNPNAAVSNITVRYNHFIHASRCMEFFSALSDGGDLGFYTGNIEVHDNVCDDIDPSHWNLSGGACCAWGVSLYVSNGFPSPNYINFLDIHHNTMLPFLTGGAVGDGPSLGFGGQSATTGAIANLKIYDNISAAGWGLSTKGICTGTKNALNNLVCFDAVSGTQLNSYCFDHNVLATTTATTGSVTGTANLPPYPGSSGPTASPNCGFSLTGTALPASYNAIQFTNLNGGINGDYTLQVGSPYHNTASDGTDPGANIPLLNQYIQGVN